MVDNNELKLFVDSITPKSEEDTKESFEEYSDFSKEAREYIEGWEPDDPEEYDDSEWFIDNYKEDVMQAFDDGRASMSEWHYISKGDLPKDADKDYLFVAIDSEEYLFVR